MADIIFTGNLGADAEMRYTQNGSPILNFRVADSKNKKDGNGGWEKVSEQWFNVSIWGSIAEYLADKLTRGTRVKVYGEYYMRNFEGKNGPGVSHDVKASAVEIFTKRDQQPQQAQRQADPWAQPQQPPAQQQHGWGGDTGGWPATAEVPF